MVSTFYSQDQIDSFQEDYPGCTEIEGDVFIGLDYPSGITNLNGLNVITAIYGTLNINSHEELTSLTGLDNLDSIGGNLELRDNISIISLEGLGALRVIGGDLVMYENQNLPDMNGFDVLERIYGTFEVGHNPSLETFSGLEALTMCGAVDMNYVHALVNMTGLENLTVVENNFEMESSFAIESLEGLSSLTSTATFILADLPELTHLTGLTSLTTVNGDFFIGLQALESIAELSNLTTVNGSFHINASSIPNLNGLENVTSINGDLQLINNSYLSSLDGLDNLDEQSIINLSILNNYQLTECEITPVCSYLLSPGGTVTIANNSSGCDSQQEVEEACKLSVEEFQGDNPFILYPNPARDEINLEFSSIYEIERIEIYNETGQLVFSGIKPHRTFDISRLPEGFYFIGIHTAENSYKNKFLVSRR